ncbi:uncharacterized protein SPSC_04592 [Sporisorium scitamineum]|uniref:Uncharacterized protein n=1 Tax=Sporisorium scitamineum TaxID=49012 RepID=A0A0F7S0B5_9BASI|nr:hypothetical protein [Sporisorium scitamineum]CDU24759.1 uncharacterized protein SPSC_04592 [Sporisorium scitamineum]
MPSSCYYIFHSPPPAPETPFSTRHFADTEASPGSAVRSESDNTLFERITNWPQEVGSSIRSIIPTSLTSLLEAVSAEAAKIADSSSKLVQSSLSSSSVTSWFSLPSSEIGTSPRLPAQAPVRSTRSSSQQDVQSTDATAPRTTTFTFCLFGAASTAAVYLLIRNRRTMNRLQSAKSLVYRDARAWRRVALDFARINALSASRVQNLVAASLRDGKAGIDIGRQIERELEDATRAVAQRRNWIQEQDRKDAESTASATSLRNFGDAWGDLLDPHNTGFFFGSRAGRRGSDLGEYGRWKPRHFTRHDDVSGASGDGLAFKLSQPWSRCSSSDSESSVSPTKRSAQLKWQRVAGHSAAAAPFTAAPSPASQPRTEDSATKDSSTSSESETEPAAREEWIGDVDRAIRERDLKTSQSATGGSDQAAVDAFSRLESESSFETGERLALRNEAERESTVEDEDHLLPVSDLHIATNGQMRDAPEASVERILPATQTKKTGMGAAKLKTTVTSDNKHSYPISDQFRDLQDIFIAAWDGNLAGLTHPASAAETTPALKPDNPGEGVRAKPNRALFERLRSNSANKDVAKTEPGAISASSDELESMAELMFPNSAAKQESPIPFEPPSLTANLVASPSAQEQELTKQLEQKQAELTDYKRRLDELSERLDSMREMCHDLTDEATRREKTHKIHVEQLDHKIGLFTVWAEEVQRRLGLETPPPFFASLRKPLKRD